MSTEEVKIVPEMIAISNNTIVLSRANIKVVAW